MPAYVAPVKVREPKAGDDPVAVAARERAGRIHANKVIAELQKWYEDVVTSYAGHQ